MVNAPIAPIQPAPPGPLSMFSSDWFRMARAREYSGLPVSTLYTIMEDPVNEIITFTLRLRKGQSRGIRFIWRPSLDAFLRKEALRDGVDPELIGAP